MPAIPGRIPGRERWEVEDKLILSDSSNKQGELVIYGGTAGEKALTVFEGANEILTVLATAAAKSITLQTGDTLDPTLILKTTNTAHQMNIYLDESMVNDKIVFEGKTAGVHTNLSIIGKDGYNGVLYLYSGSNFSYIGMISTDDLEIANTTEDKDIILSVNDGGVTKTITWDASANRLIHSHGFFDFDNDYLTTTGVYKQNFVQVVGARVIDARCDDAINSGDATTDGVIDSLRDAMIAHGLIAAA